MRPAVILLACAAVLASAPSSLAQPKKPPPAKVDPRIAEAKKLFEAGAAAYAQGNYEEAIRAWDKSYELSHKPLIFESIANAWERLGDARKARDYLARWREAAPAEERDLLDARIKNLDGRVQREEEATRKVAEEKAAREAREKAEAEAARSKWWLPGSILAGSGVALVIAGVSVGAVAKGKRPEDGACKTAGEKTFCTAAAADAVKASNTLAMVGDALWITGAAAAAAGAVLIILQRPATAKDAAPTAAAWIAPTPGGVLLGGRF